MSVLVLWPMVTTMQNKTYLSFYKTPQGEIALKKNNQLMIKLGKTSWSYYDFDKNKNDH